MRLRPELCPRTRSALAPCDLCRIVCPKSCIKLGQGKLKVSRSCTGCGACHVVCPTGAIRVGGLDDRCLADRALALPEPTFGCRSIGLDPAHVTVPCLARIGTAILLRLARMQAGRIRLISSACHRCSDQNARLLTLDRSIAAFRELRPVLGLPRLSIVEEERIPGSTETVALTRREIFTRFVPHLAEESAGGASATRSEVLKAGGQSRWIPVLHSPFGAPSIGGGCNGCEACAGICPTGALKAIRNGSLRILLRPGRCVACGTCAAVCDRGAVRLVRGLPPAGEKSTRTTLVEIGGQECTQCSAPISPDEEICVSCRRRYQIGVRPT